MKNKIDSLNTYSKIILESASQLKYDLIIISILGGVIFLFTGAWLVCQIPFLGLPKSFQLVDYILKVGVVYTIECGLTLFKWSLVSIDNIKSYRVKTRPAHNNPINKTNQ